MEKNNLKATVYARLEAIAGAEKITRVELGALSRELLLYVPESNDIDVVNRLLGVLTPVNRRVAILFFSHFLPWDVEKDADGNFSRFGKRSKGDKKVQKSEENIRAFLADETANIWTWGEDNVEIKSIDFRKGITSAIKSALAGNEKRNSPPLNHLQVLDAVFEGGLSSRDFMAYAETLAARMAEQERFMEMAGEAAAA